jgi:uncharacterized protein YjiS (DUF1127 family)
MITNDNMNLWRKIARWLRRRRPTTMLADYINHFNAPRIYMNHEH